MFEIVLYQPEIPPNAGNVIRLAANTGTRLHLVGPFNFRLDERSLRRAGLDYAELAAVEVHADWIGCIQRLAGHRVFAFTTRAARGYAEARYVMGDAFVFGPESRGLPADLLDTLPADRRLRIPMLRGNRSLNLSNAVAVVTYEAWRQTGFTGADSGSG